MSDITIKNDESQSENQKTTPVVESLIELFKFDTSLLAAILNKWLGFGYGNITFEDSLDFDISEIDSVYEDEEER